jgi:hypothetical protein
MEVYVNAATATFSPLAMVSAHGYGLASTVVTGQRHYTAVVDERLYWVGSNPNGVFAYNGQTYREGVEPLHRQDPGRAAVLLRRRSIGWQGQRAVVIGLDLPTPPTQRALLFFPRWNDWFEWSSTVFIPQTSPRLESVCLGVGSNQHKLYALAQTSDNYQDAGTDFTDTIQFRLPKR